MKCSTAGMLGNVAAALRVSLYALKVYAGLDKQLHSFLTCALEGGWVTPNPARSAVSRYKGCVQDHCAHLRFWYHVLTCVSVRLSLAASSILSCTLRYFCRSKLFSKVCNWWSVNAVRAFRCFLVRFPLAWPPLPPPAASSSLWPVT